MEGDWFPKKQDFPFRPRRRRERAYRAGGTLVQASGGHGCLKDGTDGFWIENGTACSSTFQEEESYTSYDNTSTKPREKPMVKDPSREEEIRRSSSSVIAKLTYDKTGTKPREKPMFKEISREEESRWSSSVIAKLMDRDEQPPVRLVSKQKRAAIGSFQELSPAGLRERYITRNKPSFQMSITGHHQMEEDSKVMQKPDYKNPDSKAFPNLRQYKDKMNKQCKTNSVEVCSQLENNKDSFSYTKDYIKSFRRPASGDASHPPKEHSDSFLHKLAMMHAAGENYQSIHPNHILFSNHIKGKTDSKGRRFHPTTPGNYQFAHRKWTIQTFNQKAQNGRRKIFGSRTRGLRNMSREVTEELRWSASDDKKHALHISRCHNDAISCAMSGTNHLCSSMAFRYSSDHVVTWNRTYGSVFNSTVKSVRSQATNNPGKRKVSGCSKERRVYGQDLSTLPELLFLSDKETESKSYHSSTVDNVTDEKFARTGMQVCWGASHSTINSRHSWEDGFFKNLPKPSSVPASPTSYGNQNLSILHQFDHSHYCTFNDVMNLKSKKLKLRGDSSFTSIKNRGENFYSNLGGEEDVPNTDIHITKEKVGKDELVKRSVEASPDHLSIDCEVLKVPKKGASQPCNISMIELPLSEGDSRSSRSPSGNLLENHKNCLTSEFVNSRPILLEVPTLINDACRKDFGSLPQSEHLEEEFMDEEERDYTYLLDMLIISGIHSWKQDKIQDAIYSQEYPMNPTLLDKLEKKYGKLVAWSPSERKLMFDLTNSILVEILRPCMDHHPWVNSTRKIGPMWGSEGLIEKTWQMLMRQRMELNFGDAKDKVLDFKWLDLGDSIKLIGKEIERLLKEELLEELITEFL